MEQFHSSDIRNFAIVGHGASGKTSLVEAFLKLGGEINRLGTIEDGSTVSDYHPAEKARKISIHSTPLHMECANKKFNIIDTPGYSDFIAKYGSSPDDRKVVIAHDKNGNNIQVSLDGEETVLQIFKTISESHMGELSLFRIYSGNVKIGMDYYNSNRNMNERFGQMFLLNGKIKTQAQHFWDS